MPLRFEQPVWLWTLAAAIPATLLAVRWFSAMHGVRAWIAAVIRLTLLVVLASMLAMLSTVHRNETLAVVAVVDTSGSVNRYYRGPAGESAQDAQREFLRRAARRAGPDDLVGLVAFDSRALGLARPSRTAIAERDFSHGSRDGTDLAGALQLAASMIPPEAAGRIVLLSDGVQTRGDVLAAIARARKGGDRPIPVDVVPLGYSVDREVVVEAVDAPPVAPVGGTVAIRVALDSTVPVTGVIRLTEEGRTVDINGAQPGDGRRIALEAGLNIQRIEVPLGQGRVHRFRVIFEPDVEPAPGGGTRPMGDTVAENNSAETFTVTPGRGSVLLVDAAGEGAESSTLARTLRDAGLEVAVRPPPGVPADLLGVEPFDLVILQDVPAEELTERQQRTLAAYVSDLGGGLVMIGGPNSFGPGRWQGTPVEPLLPVLLDVPDVVLAPQAATVFVLDNSGSMWRLVLGTGRSQQEIANDAAALAVRSLDRSDLVGVVTFNSESSVLVPLGRNADPAKTAETIRGIGSGGGTNLGPALNLAREQLNRAAPGVKLRHIVVMTDGVSRGKKNLPDLAGQLAADGIQLTTIAVGDDADLDGLRHLAEIGHGGFFHAANATQLPRLLLKAVRVVRSPLIREDPFKPIVVDPASPLVVGLGAAPPLRGLVLSKARTEPTVSTPMLTPAGEPVLAHWNAGAGRVAAWTSDAGRWAAEWIDTPAYRGLWTQVARVTARPPTSPGLAARAESRGDRIHLRLDVSGEDGAPWDGLNVVASVHSPSGDSRTIPLSQTGSGQYEGSSPATEAGAYLAVIKPETQGRALSPVVAGATIMEGEEFRQRRSDNALLEKIAAQTGGRVLEIGHPEQAALFDREGISPREYMTPVWTGLLAWALALFLADVAVRRIAWDRWLSRSTEPALVTAAAGATTSALRAAVGEAPRQAEASIALGEREARELALAARDRRRAQRLAGIAGPETAPGPEKGSKASPEPQGENLLAAKRRAARRFDENPPD